MQAGLQKGVEGLSTGQKDDGPQIYGMKLLSPRSFRASPGFCPSGCLFVSCQRLSMIGRGSTVLNFSELKLLKPKRYCVGTLAVVSHRSVRGLDLGLV